MRLTIGFSPCPNDTFIFDALVNKKIDTGEFEFDVVLEDVQTLNRWAMQRRLDISKISYGVLPLLLDNYIVLNSGSALGKGVGPLLIVLPENKEEGLTNEKTVAIPGENTTAHMLFSLAYPQEVRKQFMMFNAVESAVINKEVDAGVIIHENRFTYQDKGLTKLADLGEYWEETTGNPIPLGGIVGKRALGVETLRKVDQLIKESVSYGFENYPDLSDYVCLHAQEMNEDVMRQHINLYVNDFSLDLGRQGKDAIVQLLTIYQKTHPEQKPNKTKIFLE